MIGGGQPWSPPTEYLPEGWTPYTEADKIQDWREDQLERVGVHPRVARILARSESDLHSMVEAFQAGLSEEGLVAVFT